MFAFGDVLNETIALGNDGVGCGDGHIHSLIFFQGFHDVRQCSAIQKRPGPIVDQDVVWCVIGQCFEAFEGRGLAADAAGDHLDQGVVFEHARHFVHIGKWRSHHNPHQWQVLSQRAQTVFQNGFACDAHELFRLVTRHAAARASCQQNTRHVFTHDKPPG